MHSHAGTRRGVLLRPPFGGRNDGKNAWIPFLKHSVNQLNDDGYLAYVHPPGWRKPNTSRGKFNGMYKKMAIDNQMIYLEMHNTKDGQKVFNKGTRYDFYLLQKTKRTGNTLLNDENYNKSELDLSVFEWLPNSNISDIMKILTDTNVSSSENCPVIYNRSNYGSDKKYVSKTESEENKYPLVHATNKNGIRYMYSNCNDKGHFGVSKVIFGQTGINDVIIDLDGKYGMTEHAIAIEVTDLVEANNLKLALLSTKFNETLKSTMYSNFMIDWRIFTSFKRDWWCQYIDDDLTPQSDDSIVVNLDTGNDINPITSEIHEETKPSEKELNKMTVPQLKKYIKDNKLKIKLGQKKNELIKDILRD